MTTNNPIEIICVGNELLIGKTLNTNAQWLGKCITSLGLSIRRITTISDNLKEISRTIKEALNRKPSLLIITGGLGPTFDDKTLAGIAKALKLELQLNKEALQMIKEKYRNYAKEKGIKEIKLTSHRLKMAKLPKGAKPLPNPIGTAPGVIIQHNNTLIIALPGVPSEMKAICEDSIVPLLKKNLKSAYFYEQSLFVTGIMESTLAPLIEKTMHNNPYVYIKSHPKGEEKKPQIELHLSTTATNLTIAKERVKKTLDQLSEIIEKAGGKIRLGKTAA